MKKILSMCMILLISLIPIGSVFADDSVDISKDASIESPLDFKPFQTSNDKLRLSVSGSGGTANLDYMSKGKYLAWRLTSKKGVILALNADVTIYDSKGKFVAAYPLMDGAGVTKSGTINVNWLKRGRYKAKMTGFGTAQHGIISIKNGVEISFTR